MKKINCKNAATVILSVVSVFVIVFSILKTREANSLKDEALIKYEEMLKIKDEEKYRSEQLTLDNLSGFWIGANKNDNEVKVYHISSIGEYNSIIAKSKKVTFNDDNTSSMTETIQDLNSGFHKEFLMVKTTELEPSLHSVEYGDFIRGALSVDNSRGFARLESGGVRDYLHVYAGGDNYYHMARLNAQDLDPNRAYWKDTTKDTFYEKYIREELKLDYGGRSEKMFVEDLQSYYNK